jgi:hypothetical protein
MFVKYVKCVWIEIKAVKHDLILRSGIAIPHAVVYSDDCLLVCDAVWFGRKASTFPQICYLYSTLIYRQLVLTNFW